MLSNSGQVKMARMATQALLARMGTLVAQVLLDQLASPVRMDILAAQVLLDQLDHLARTV